jgi:hypothetical protein
VAGHQSRIEAAAATLTDRVAHWRAAAPQT